MMRVFVIMLIIKKTVFDDLHWRQKKRLSRIANGFLLIVIIASLFVIIY
jgi:hypothetical protein